jgi:CcmD family protein
MDGIRHRAWSAIVTLGLHAVAGTAAIVAQAQDEFKPASPDDLALERLPATPFVVAAYAIVWIVLIGYVFVLWRRLGRVEQEMAALTARLDQPRR